MARLSGKTVFISGASAGIGRSCARSFATEGARLIVCARRRSHLTLLADDLARESGATVTTLVLDVTDNDAVEKAVASLSPDWAKVDILINNAGLARALDPSYGNTVSDIDDMVDTNVKGLLYLTRAIVPGMVERNAGHIINIGSIAGHEVYPGATVYCATKFAVGAISRGLKIDLHGTNVRVSSVDPGMVRTEFGLVRFHGDRDRAATYYDNAVPLTPEDVADAVLYCATRPSHVNVNEMILMSTAQSSATLMRGPDKHS